MSKRNTGRRLAMQVLYQMETGQKDLNAVMNLTFQTDVFQADTLEFARKLIEGAWDKRDTLDAEIGQYSESWSLIRISAIDKAVMRVAIYEILLGEEPISVIINEALNIAKKYSEADSFRFVNGILDRIAKTHQNV